MASYFGFPASDSQEYYMISYSNDDAKRIAPIANAMNEKGVELWYDDGIKGGEEWKAKIFGKIRGCKAVILFVTQALIERKETFVQIEYNYAKDNGKSVIPIFLDEFVPSRASDDGYTLLKSIEKLHGVDASEKSERAADTAQRVIDCLNGKTGVLMKKKRRKIMPVAIAVIALIAAISAVGAWLNCDGTPAPVDTTGGGETGSPSSVNGEETAASQVSYKVGDVVNFGTYWISAGGGKEDLEWIVADIDEEDDSAILISRYGLFYSKFSDTRTNIWNESKVWKELNNDGSFKDDAFSKAEYTIIDAVPDTSVSGKIFCLNQDEFKKYKEIKDSEDGESLKKCKPTDFAFSNVPSGNKNDNDKNGDYWWLREKASSGTYNIMCVNKDGEVASRTGKPYDTPYVLVRPAIYVKYSEFCDYKSAD